MSNTHRGHIIGTVIILRRKSFMRYPQARVFRKYAVVMASKVPIRFSGGYRNMIGIGEQTFEDRVGRCGFGEKNIASNKVTYSNIEVNIIIDKETGSNIEINISVNREIYAHIKKNIAIDKATFADAEENILSNRDTFSDIIVTIATRRVEISSYEANGEYKLNSPATRGKRKRIFEDERSLCPSPASNASLACGYEC